MQGSEHPSERLRFGVFEVDLRAGELRKHGLQIRLQEQPFQVLAILLEHGREVVTREELQKKLWSADTFVDFDQGLNKAINKIREALSDSAETPRFVETVARRGYRFLAEVTVVDAAAQKGREPANKAAFRTRDRDRTPSSGEQAARRRLIPSLAWRISGSLLVLLLVILLAWTFHSRNRPPLAIRSLAVLPLENLSADASQDYFADGMTDELITDLGQINSLRVISRTSVMAYKGARKPLAQIARELNVDAVVEGTVLRSGDQVRITAQLIEASADKHLWYTEYGSDLRGTWTGSTGILNLPKRSFAAPLSLTLRTHQPTTGMHGTWP